MPRKKRNIWFLIAIISLVVIGMFLQKQYSIFSITGNEIISRDLPTEVKVGESFQLTYTVSGATGKWGASIVDNINGGCKFPDGSTQLKTVMLSTDGNTKTITITAPNSESTCTFTGDYQFGTASIKTFPTQTVIIKSCNTEADINCDKIVDRDELGIYINKWIEGQISRTKLGEIIMAWIGGE